MSARLKGRLLCLLAIVIDVGAPLTMTVKYFPIWVEKSAEATISGIVVFLALLSAIPLIRVIKEKLKSPSAWMIWLLMFLLFLALEPIVKEVKMISLVGFGANLVGAVIYKTGKRLIDKESE